LRDTAATRLLAAFDQQVGWCTQGASPFSASVLALSRRWLEGEPEALALLAAVEADPLAAAVPLRWLGALHHLALLGREPWMTLWPPAEPPHDDALTAAIARAWHDQRAHLVAALARAPQTNEVMRSAALLPGLLHVAQALQRPLHLAEIGASAGLNLWADRYRHEPLCDGADAAWAWGDTAAALTLRATWRGPAPPVGAPLTVARRAGCDAAPVDLSQPGEDLRLASFVWADQPERLARLRAAVAGVRPRLAAAAAVQARQAADFVREQLALRRAGEAFVLMHSVVWQYIAAAEQADIQAQMQAAGANATAASPVAWLCFEPLPGPSLHVALRCTTWPGGEDRLLAEAHPHGAWVHWRADAGLPAAGVAASAA
jgi:hypothetical protein